MQRLSTSREANGPREVKALRLTFVKTQANWTAEAWSKVICTCESKINLFGPDE